MELNKEFSRFKNGVKENYPLSLLTSFRVGGPCDYLVQPATVEELSETIKSCRRYGVYYKVIGRGTNILVRDGGIRGVVIHIGEDFSYWELQGNKVHAGSAVYLPRLAREVIPEGLSGLEFASGIPGSLGGALVMNAGAYGRTLGDLVEKVTYLEPDGIIKELPSSEINFAYRWSSFKEKKGIIVAARLKLKQDDPHQIQGRVEEILEQRRQKQPSLPSAGSVFKNPPSAPAGRLIEDAGCKGMQVGEALVSPKHANFIVNSGQAKAADILKLISAVQEKVKEHVGIDLHLEIEVVGED